MTEHYFIDLPDMMIDAQAGEAQARALEQLMQPWLPVNVQVVGRLVRAPLHAGTRVDYVVFTEQSVYFALVDVQDEGALCYQLHSVKCFLVCDLIAYAFLMGPAPEIRLMLSGGKRIKLRLANNTEEAAQANAAYMQNLAKSPFLTGK